MGADIFKVQYWRMKLLLALEEYGKQFKKMRKITKTTNDLCGPPLTFSISKGEETLEWIKQTSRYVCVVYVR